MHSMHSTAQDSTGHHRAAGGDLMCWAALAALVDLQQAAQHPPAQQLTSWMLHLSLTDLVL